MPTSYTSLLGLALPVTGELSGTWGDTVNDYITKYIDASVAGTQTISGSQTAVTLSTTTGTTLSQAGSGATGSSQYMVINCTGNPGGLLTITAPAASKAYLILNNTSTAQSVKIVGTGPTTGVTIASAQNALVAWNGSDFELVATIDASKLTGVLAAINGGTGQSSYAVGDLLYASSTTALAKLAGVATGNALISGGVSTAPSWGKIGLSTHVSGTLPIANGGTGATTIPARSVFVANALDTLTTVTPAAGQSIRINAGNTAWEAYTPSTGSGDAVLANNNAFTGANTFYNNTGQTFGTGTSTQDGVIIAGRAGGSSSYRITLTPAALASSTTLSLPNVTDTVATIGTAQTFTAAQTFRASNSVRAEAAATQDAIVLAGRAGGTSSYAVTLTPATLSASRTLTLPEPGENVTLGYLNIPQNSQSAAYQLVLTDAGKHILHPSADTSARTFTIPANGTVAFPIGTAVTFINQNGAGTVTIAITTDTMRLAGAGTTGNRTLAANGVATAIKITSTEWIISGTGLT